MCQAKVSYLSKSETSPKLSIETMKKSQELKFELPNSKEADVLKFEFYDVDFIYLAVLDLPIKNKLKDGLEETIDIKKGNEVVGKLKLKIKTDNQNG